MFKCKFLSSLFQSKLNNQDNQLIERSCSNGVDSSHAQEANSLNSEAEAASRADSKSANNEIEKQEPILMDVLRQTIDSIDLKSHVQNSKDINLLKLYKFVNTSDEFKTFVKQFGDDLKRAIVAGKVKLHDNDESKDHIWMIVGFDDNYHLSYDFIYNQSEKFSDKLIIDLQPLLDDVNNDVLILEYNSHPQYRPYGHETITDVDKYFQSKQHLKNITLYQPKEYEYAHGGCDLYLTQDEDFFRADIVLFLLDSDFIVYPHRYVDIMDEELFKSIVNIVHRLSMRLDTCTCLYIKSYLVHLLIHNEKAKFISNNCLIMFNENLFYW